MGAMQHYHLYERLRMTRLTALLFYSFTGEMWDVEYRQIDPPGTGVRDRRVRGRAGPVRGLAAPERRRRAHAAKRSNAALWLDAELLPQAGRFGVLQRATLSAARGLRDQQD